MSEYVEVNAIIVGTEVQSSSERRSYHKSIKKMSASVARSEVVRYLKNT